MLLIVHPITGSLEEEEKENVAQYSSIYVCYFFSLDEIGFFMCQTHAKSSLAAAEARASPPCVKLPLDLKIAARYPRTYELNACT